MSKSALVSQAAGQRRNWFSAAAQGTRLPVGGLVTPAGTTGVFAGPRPAPHSRTKIAVQQITDNMYQEMARITVNDGAQSGSHPAWDPV